MTFHQPHDDDPGAVMGRSGLLLRAEVLLPLTGTPGRSRSSTVLTQRAPRALAGQDARGLPRLCSMIRHMMPSPSRISSITTSSARNPSRRQHSSVIRRLIDLLGTTCRGRAHTAQCRHPAASAPHGSPPGSAPRCCAVRMKTSGPRPRPRRSGMRRRYGAAVGVKPDRLVVADSLGIHPDPVGNFSIRTHHLPPAGTGLDTEHLTGKSAAGSIRLEQQEQGA
jgi:hypothetical protein